MFSDYYINFNGFVKADHFESHDFAPHFFAGLVGLERHLLI